jgi:uncharacterized protein (DUF885 family)
MTAIDDLCRSYLDLKWHFDPAAATAAGAVAHDGRLGAYDAESMREHVAAFHAIAAGVEELEVESLDDEIDRTALLNELRATEARLLVERPHVRNPEFWLSHVLGALYGLLARPDGEPASRAQPALDRLEAMPAFLDAARATLAKPPSVFVDTALQMLGGGGELVVQTMRTFAPAAPGLAERLTAAAEAALKSLAAFGRALQSEIEADAEPRAFAVGQDHFELRLHVEHALKENAGELHRYGRRLQAETMAELDALARSIDGDRPWRELVERLREQTPGGDLLAHYSSEVERSLEFVRERGLVAVPDGPLAVEATPPFLSALIPFAAYEPPPTLLPTRVGRFYVTEPPAELAPDARARLLRDHCVHDLVWTVVHEGYPGHHLQLLTAQGLASEVRRHLWTPVFVEGWALYGETLMAESGFARGPEERLFQLVNLLWRAVRVVLDTALHTGDMTPVQAVDYLVAHLPMERAHAEAEVRRYCATPTYQLSYAVGRREILALRDAWRRRAGPDAPLGGFHDELLRYGGLPPALVRWGMGLDA